MGDREIRQVILEELDFEPSLHSTDLGIAVDGGVATITGHVPCLADKSMVIKIVESVRGVRAIADQIEVRPVGSHVTADDEIAKRVINILKWSTTIPDDRIRTTVARGWVTLRGNVDWRYQSHSAERAVRGLIGVRGVNNQLKVVPAAFAENVGDRIRGALMRNAELDAAAIHITVDGSVVTLEGQVHDLTERRSAERAAWAAPGVTDVIDRLSVI